MSVSRASALAALLRGLARAGKSELFVVGGWVRDDLLGRPTRDADLIVAGDPRPLAAAAVRKWGARSETFDRFGTARLIFPGGERVDLARARKESYPAPAALPVVEPAGLSEDLGRRDFTINAMARPLTRAGTGALIDPFAGAADLAARRLRVLHAGSFEDDPTRMFRAARYGGRFGFSLERGTAALLRSAADGGLAARLSRERVRQELFRLLEEKNPDPAMRRLRAWGLAKSFHPRFAWTAAAAAAAGPLVRLGLCALAMPRGAGAELVRSLPLERASGRALLAALEAAAVRASPREELPPLAAEVLRRGLPRLAPAAARPALIRGGDLRDSGLPPGRDISLWTARAARAQWDGVFSTRPEALRWLKKLIK